MSEATHFQSITELAPHIEAGDISPVELTTAQLARIEQLDPQIRSYATVMTEVAMSQARQAERDIHDGRYRGPLHGIPIAVKDLCATAGTRTMGGSAVFADNIPDNDATVVTRLRDAGAVLLGKLNLTEGAMGGYHPGFDYPENPWGKACFPGASSSGSGAATAAGLAYATLGSDTGGSIRYPAAACGTVGLKPTWGRVSRFGVMDLAPSLDHVGPLTRSTQDAALVLQAIAGHDPRDPTSLRAAMAPVAMQPVNDLHGIRIGFDQTYASADLRDDYAEAIRDQVSVFEALGARFEPVTMPSRLSDYLTAWPVLCSSEAANVHRTTFPSQANDYGPWFRQWLEMGAAFSAADYARAHELRLACNGEIAAMMQGLDALLFPGAPGVAHSITPESMKGPMSDDRDTWHSRFTVPFDFNGYPTLSLPCGLSETSLPFSLQLAAHPLQEDVLTRLGNAFESATSYHRQHPPAWP